MTILYISYDGLTEPLGQSQVLAYLERLSARGHRFLVISFEKEPAARADEMSAVRARCEAQRILWRPLTYHRRPPVVSTVYDALRGLMAGWRVCAAYRPHAVHARSDVPALMGFVLKCVFGLPLVFDMRGFWVDERIDGGLWASGGAVARLARRIENRLIARADRLIVLTQSMARELERRGARGSTDRVSVIPTCVDIDRFKPAAAPPRDPLTLVYAGSLGTVYMARELFRFASVVIHAAGGGRLLLVSRQARESWVAGAMREAGLDPACVESREAPHEALPGVLAAAHVGLAFYKPGPSVTGRYPTKVGEYLACGVPVVVNRHVEDAAALVRERRVGAVLEEFSEEAYGRAAAKLLQLREDGPALRERCRRAAEDALSLELGVERYAEVYTSL